MKRRQLNKPVIYTTPQHFYRRVTNLVQKFRRVLILNQGCHAIKHAVANLGGCYKKCFSNLAGEVPVPAKSPPLPLTTWTVLCPGLPETAT